MNAPFRFGLVATARTAQDWFALAHRVEGLGFHSLLVPDNLGGTAPLLACTAAAAVTSRLVVGPYVLATPWRVPGLVAAEVASLELLASGRVEVGLGAGRPDAQAEAEQLGMPFGTPAQRLARLEETVAAVRERVPAARVVVAASGPRMLALAGRTADVVALGASPYADEHELARMGRIVTVAAADRSGDVVLNQNLALVGEVVPAWLETRMGVTLARLESAGSAALLRGTPRQMADTLQHRRDSTGVSYVCASADSAALLAPVVELLQGR